MKRAQAALLAVLAAASLGLAGGCTDESPIQTPGGEQEGEQENGGEEDD